MEKTLEEIENELRIMVEREQPHEYRKRAMAELEKVKELGLDVPNVAFIVSRYPDFDHVEFQLIQTNAIVLKVCVSIDELRKDKETFRVFAQFIYEQSKEGHFE